MALNGYEASSLAEVEAVLDGLSPATSEEVYLGTLDLDSRAVAAVAASRADAGGGASFPDEWTVGANGSLGIAGSDPAAPLVDLTSAPNQTAPVLRVERPDGDSALGVSLADGATNLASFGIVMADGSSDPAGQVGAFDSGPLAAYSELNARTASSFNGNLEINFDPSDTGNAIVVTDGASGDTIFKVSQPGSVFFHANAAPADADIEAGQVALWFDATNGAAKLMIKGKSANGTVVTGQVALT